MTITGTGTYLDELSERETAPAVDHRTMPHYPTAGPGDGRTWGEFFRDIKFSINGQQDPEEEGEPEPGIEVLEPAAELPDPQAAPGAPGTLAKRLSAAGWDVRAQASRVRVPAALYASDAGEGAEVAYRKGDVRFPEYELESYAIQGVKRAGGQMLAVAAYWERKVGGGMKFRYAETHDPILGRERRTSVTKPRKPYEWEAAEGVEPPLGLNQWLSIVCPKPEPKKKTKAKEAVAA